MIQACSYLENLNLDRSLKLNRVIVWIMWIFMILFVDGSVQDLYISITKTLVSFY